MRASSSRKRNKAGNFIGVPEFKGKLYFSSKDLTNKSATMLTTQLATPYYNLAELHSEELEVPNLEIQSFEPNYQVKIDQVTVNLADSNDSLVEKGKNYLKKQQNAKKRKFPIGNFKQKCSKIIKKINQIKSFWDDGLYSIASISKKLNLSRSFIKDVLECLKIGINPEDRVISEDQKIPFFDELRIRSYFKKDQNIGKSIKDLGSYINKERSKKIPARVIKKIIRKTGVRYVKREVFKKKYNPDYSNNRQKRHSSRLLDLFLSDLHIIFIDTVKFSTQDYNDKIWIKKDSILHKNIKQKGKKGHFFDMIVASEQNLGIISAMGFERSHGKLDMAFFLNKLIEQCKNMFREKKAIIFLDNSPLQRPSLIDEWVGSRITFFYNQVSFIY